MSLKDFENIGKLGQGAYSIVYKVMRISDKQTYALKKIKIASLTSKQKQNALNEVRILASINHPNIIGYKEAFFDETAKSLCIVMQYADNGDVGSKIQNKKVNKGIFFQQQIWEILKGILKGLSELHKIGVYHRDLKPANIFLSKQGKNSIAKIGDLNVSKISQNNMCMTQTGTPYYASPQVWKDQPYNQKSDIWSLGCVIYQMICLKPPFQAEDMESLYKKVTRGIYPKIPSNYSSELSSMVRSLLQLNAQSRPSCQKLLRNTNFLKHTQKDQQIIVEKIQLMKTIKGQNFNQLNELLPKSNYKTNINNKQKNLKLLMDQMDQKFRLNKAQSNKKMSQVHKAFENDFIQKQRIRKLSQQRPNKKNSDRTYLTNKQSIKLLNRERKKSEISLGKPTYLQQKHSASKHSLHNLIDAKYGNQLKLPKVPNRYNKIKQRLNKQKSLKIHKIFND